MFRWLALAVVMHACSAPSRPPAPRTVVEEVDPDGPNRAAVEAQLRPYLDGEIVASVVVGLYDAGRREIYGFGKGPGGKRPDGRTLYEIGSVTKVYTSLLLADAVQRREVAFDTELSELLPPGVTAPTFDKRPITLHHLALHTSGLPRLPPSIAAESADPYRSYDEDKLFADLTRTRLAAPPGARLAYSNYGSGLLGHVLGKKLGVGYRAAVQTRLLAPLELRDTVFDVPPALAARRAPGASDDLKPAAFWSWDVLAGAGALVSSVRDQLAFVEAELDAIAGGKGPLRNAMRLTQENQVEGAEQVALGWQVDSAGRYWHNGGTAGHRSFVAFDPKHRRGVVVLAAGSSSLVDRIGAAMQDLLDGSAKDPPKLPTEQQLASYAGTYHFGDTRLAVVHANQRLYVEGPGEPRHRLLPASPNEFWIEPLQALAVFQLDELPENGGKVAQIVFQVGGQQLVAPRVP